MIPALVSIGILASAAIGRRGARVCGGDRGLWACLGPGAAAAAGLVVCAALAAPFSPWDTTRIAPSLALIRGHSPYASAGSGAVLSTMYGPVAPLAYLPAALVGDAAAAAILGRLLAFGFAFVPLSLCCTARDVSAPQAWRATILIASTFALLLCPSLGYSSTFLHADAPALGLTGLACMLAARRTGPGLAAAVACVLAALTKQTMATLPLGLLAWSWFALGPRSALRFAAFLAVSGLAALGVVRASLDWDALVLNAVRIPGGVPWKGTAPGNLLAVAAEMMVHGAPLIAAATLAWSRPSVGGADRRAVVFLIAALALAPMAVLGRVKQAGDVNSFSPCLYPLLLAAASRAVSVAPPGSPWGRRAILAGLVALIAAGSLRIGDEARRLAKERPYQCEVAFLRSRPGTVYFPWNPAAHLAVGGTPTHHLFSAWERGVAGFPVSESHLRSGLPEGCRYVAFPLKRLGPVAGFGSCIQMLERYDLLACPIEPLRLAGLPDYECYELRR